MIQYIEQGILPTNPFQQLDREGVGKLIEMSVKLGRSTRPAMAMGICGELPRAHCAPGRGPCGAKISAATRQRRRRYTTHLAISYIRGLRKTELTSADVGWWQAGVLATEPYEVGWATEARWFGRVLASTGEGARLVLTAQISPDGIRWCDQGSPPLVISGQGDAVPELYSLRLTHFGHWLRLRGKFVEEAASFTVIIYNEIATKQNWHYLRLDCDLATMAFLHFQCNDRHFDLAGVEPMRIPAMANLWCMLNTACRVETDRDKRAFLYLVSVLLSSAAG